MFCAPFDTSLDLDVSDFLLMQSCREFDREVEMLPEIATEELSEVSHVLIRSYSLTTRLIRSLALWLAPGLADSARSLRV